jgi:hypothetical protein
MIRDPSDGSVREALKRHQEEMRECNPPTADNSTPAKFTSGLPITKAKAEYLARLEESRKWLKEYVRSTING